MALYETDGMSFFNTKLLHHISWGENDKAQAFLARIENPNALRNSVGRTLLHIAARYGNVQMIQHLIDMGFEIDALCKHHLSPLALAVQFDHVLAVKVLLEAKADIYSTEHGDCLLKRVHTSIVMKEEPGETDRRILKLFSRKVNKDFYDDPRNTVSKLLEADCSLDLAIMMIRRTKALRMYRQRGYSLNTADPRTQRTALHGAVQATHARSVCYLLRQGVDVNAMDSAARTPLCYYNCLKSSRIALMMLHRLISCGAQLGKLADRPDSIVPAVHLIARAPQQVVRIVLYDISAVPTGKLGTFLLAKNTNPGVMAVLGKEPFEVDNRDEQGDTLLMVAIACKSHLSNIEFLLDRGVDVNAANNHSETALLYAVNLAFRKGKPGKVSAGVVKLLLQRGANVQHEFEISKVLKKRVTIFDLFLRKIKLRVAKLLLSQLVLDNARGENITDLVFRRIMSLGGLRNQFTHCKNHIQKMKAATITDSLTLFDLMIANEDFIVDHVIDYEFTTKVSEAVKDISEDNPYFAEIVNTKLESILQKLKSTEEYRNIGVPQSSCSLS
ncbi:ankyrin-3-like isoform X2 [Phymastichus coffea]|uniref:ankyrin-3-like isoform X2 n=1 Tax=Phymastichus coffea TaxID=108790 RepID=UPI00273C657E|nr:ankyrin-3-like isoform X2 [Phymastichus coffea]